MEWKGGRRSTSGRQIVHILEGLPGKKKREGRKECRKEGREERGVTVREGGVHAIYLSSWSGKNVGR